jgi:hypothetical protein
MNGTVLGGLAPRSFIPALRRSGRKTPFGRMAYPETRGKEKGPEPKFGAFCNLSRRRPTFPHSYPCSIIGPARLNFRVRDGNGCDPRGMTTGKSVPEVFKTSGQIRNHRDETRSAMATTVVGWRYKFGPLPNRCCDHKALLVNLTLQPLRRTSFHWHTTTA